MSPILVDSSRAEHIAIKKITAECIDLPRHHERKLSIPSPTNFSATEHASYRRRAAAMEGHGSPGEQLNASLRRVCLNCSRHSFLLPVPALPSPLAPREPSNLCGGVCGPRMHCDTQSTYARPCRRRPRHVGDFCGARFAARLTVWARLPTLCRRP
jgi:hypothetical protein